MRKLLIVTSAALLSACGGQPAAPGNEAAPAGEAAPAAASGFNAEDACALLPKEKVAEIAGVQVDDAALSRVTQGTAETAGFSQCTYNFAGGGTIDFFARRSPVDDNSPEAIQRTKQGLVENIGAKVSDIPGLGIAAFSAEPMSQLHVFFGGSRYIYFMSMTPPKGKPVLEVEEALAKAVIG